MRGQKTRLVPRTNLISIGLMRGSVPTFLIAQDVGLVPRTNLISIGLMRGSVPTFLIAQDVTPVPRTGRHTIVCLYIRVMRVSVATLRG